MEICPSPGPGQAAFRLQHPVSSGQHLETLRKLCHPLPRSVSHGRQWGPKDGDFGLGLLDCELPTTGPSALQAMDKYLWNEGMQKGQLGAEIRNHRAEGTLWMRVAGEGQLEKVTSRTDTRSSESQALLGADAIENCGRRPCHRVTSRLKARPSGARRGRTLPLTPPVPGSQGLGNARHLLAP